MSMILIFWKAPLVPDACAAEVLLRRWYKREDDRELEPSEKVRAFADELVRRYPPTAFGRDDRGRTGGPWADLPFTRTDSIVELSLSWSADPEIIDDICRLAREHELLVYDPQSGDVHLPGDPAEAEKIPPLRAGDWLRAIAMAAGIGAITSLAWLIPVGWLRWPLLGLGAFFTAAALFVLFAMGAGALGMLDGKSRDA
jgi:hypothetical protein